MNRAWIPAGALAGVSVAGLLALGPITDSPVSFPGSVPVPPTTAKTQQIVRVSVKVNENVSGKTQTAAFATTRGGQAEASSSSTTSGSDGYVGYRRSATPTTVTKIVTKKATTPVKKKAPKRQSSIGATESNSDAGLAGGSTGGSTNTGEASGAIAP